MSDENILSVYMADDHALIVETLAEVIRNHSLVEKVEVFQDGEQLYRRHLHKAADLIFLDLEMKGWSGIQTLEYLNKLPQNFKTVILSMVNEKTIINHCLKLGVNGYLHKDSTKEELYNCIETVVNNQQYLSERVKIILKGRKEIDLTNEISPNLTKREYEILNLICQGLSPQEIADTIFISKRTVEVHKQNIMTKFDVNSTAKLISVAMKNNHSII